MQELQTEAPIKLVVHKPDQTLAPKCWLLCMIAVAAFASVDAWHASEMVTLFSIYMGDKTYGIAALATVS